MTGLVASIQRFSIHDGPGIRTTVFLKGCSLRCPWCHNPETIRGEREVLWYPDRCIGCGACAEVCAEHHRFEGGVHRYKRAGCDQCLAAAGRCPAGALVVSGRATEAEALVGVVLRDRPFFDESAGGVTISGGEPLYQARFTAEVLALLRREGVHTCLDTAADGDTDALVAMVPFVDVFLVDCKETRDAQHRALTGRPLAGIVENLRAISDAGATVYLRCPIVPGVNDDPAHLREIGVLAESVEAIREVHVLPFHRTGAAKWVALGLRFRFGDLDPPSAGDVERYASEIATTTGKPVVTPPRTDGGA